MGKFLEYINKSNKKKDEEKISSFTTTQMGNFGKYAIGKTIGIDTLQSDLISLNKTLQTVYNGWQTRETMENTRASIQSMYDRLDKYQEYQKMNGGTDLSELQNSYKSVLDGWEGLSKNYGRYKNADAYNNAIKITEKQVAEYEGMKTAKIGAIQTEVADIEDTLKIAKGYEQKVKDLTNGSMNIRNPSVIESFSESVQNAINERDSYLKEKGYKSVADVEKALSEKKTYLNRAELIQKGIELASVGDETSKNHDKDFAEKSKYVAPKQKTGFVFGSTYDEDVYKYINDKDYRTEYNSRVNSSGDAALLKVGYEYMTDKEKATYNYYHNTFGVKKGNEYLNTIKEEIGARKALADFENYEGKLGKELLFGVNAGLDQFMSGARNLLNTSDEYIPINSTQQLSGLIRENIKYEHGTFGQVGYDLINTTSNMLPSILTSTVVSAVATPAIGANVGAGVMGASAAGNAYQEMLNLGYDKGQAKVYSTLVGLSEAGLQRVIGGIGKLGGVSGKLSKAVSSIDNSIAKFAIQHGGKVLSEGFEEAAQEVLNPLFMNIAAGYDTGAEVDWGEVAYSGLLGALSGGFFGGIDSYAEYSANKKIGASVKANERIGDVLDVASNTEVASAYDTYTRYAKKGIDADSITDLQLGELYTKAKSDAQDILDSKKSTKEQKEAAQIIIADLETYAQYNPSMGTDKKSVKAIYNDVESIVGIIESGLESDEKSESYKLAAEYKAKIDNYDKLSEIVTKKMNGETLTEEEAQLLNESKNSLSKKEIKALADANEKAIRTEERDDIATELEKRGENKEVADIVARKMRGEIITTDEAEKLMGSEEALSFITEKSNAENVTEELMEMSKSIDKEKRALFISLYDGKTDVDVYSNAFNLVSTKAENNYTYDDILKHGNVLSGEQINKIYAEMRIKADQKQKVKFQRLIEKTAGLKEYKAVIDDSVIDYENTSTKGKVNWNTLDSRTRKAITFVKGFAKATGVNLTLVTDGKEQGFNGAFITDDNTIILDVFAGKDIDLNNLIDTIIPTMSHELTHWMEKKSPVLYRKINELVFSTLQRKDGLTEDQRIALEIERKLSKEYKAVYERNNPGKKIKPNEASKLIPEDVLKDALADSKRTEEARSEIIARACEDMLSRSKVGREIFNSLSASERKTLVDKIKELIQNIKDWVSEFLGSCESNAREAVMLRKYKEELDRLSVLWDKMLSESVEVNQALEKSGKYRNESAEGEMKLQAREVDDGGNSYWQIETDKDIFKGITTVKGLQSAAYNYILNGDKGNVITTLIDGEELRFIRVSAEEYVYGKASKKLSEGEYKQKMRMATSIIDLIENASIEYDAPDHKNHKLFPGGFKNYQGRVGIDETIFRYIVRVGKAKNGKIFYDINLEVDVRVPRANKSTSPIKMSTSNNSISNSKPKVNIKFSDRDSVGRELSEMQKEYFKDSAVRDENGNLKVMYRGDSSEFTVFDRKKSSYSNLYGRGFYFTDSKAHAEQYGNSREFYLDIKNPLSPGQNTITKEQMLDFLKGIENDGEDYDLYNYGEKATAESVLNLVWGKGDYEMLQDINASAIGDFVAAVELFNEVNGTNYDGIILPAEVVTLNSEQAKLTSNLNPTKDKDIRYSDRITAVYDVEGYLFSPSTNDAEKFRKQVDKWFSGEMTSSEQLDIGKTPIVLKELGAKELPIVMSQDVIVKMTGGKHNISLDEIKKIPEAIADPIMIFKSATVDNAFVILTELLDKSGNDVVVALHLNKKYNRLSVNRIASAYGKDNVNSFTEEQFRNKNILYADKIKSQKWSTSKGLQLPKLVQSISDNNIILHKEDIVNRYNMQNTEKNVSRDILYSDRDDTSVYDVMGEKERLIKEREKLREDIERLKERLKIERKVTNGSVFNNNHLLSAAGHLRKISNSTIDKVDLARSLKDVYSFIRDSEDPDIETIYAKCYEVAVSILEKGKPETIVDDYYKTILKDIRSTKISISELQKQEAKNIFDKYWNRYFFGNITITDSGVPIESKWKEWANTYPGIFKEDISDGDMLSELHDIIYTLREASETIVEYDTSERETWLANEIYNQYWNVSNIETTADKYNKRIEQLNLEHKKMMIELREAYKDRIENQKLADDMYYGRRLLDKDKKLKEQHKSDMEHSKEMQSKIREAYKTKLKEQHWTDRDKYIELYKKLRERKDAEIAKAKEHGKERLNKYKENAERKTYIQRITADSLSLNEMLLKNSKDKHIPEIMKGPVVSLIQAIDFSSKRLIEKGEPTKTDISLSKALRKVKDMMVEATNAHDGLVELYGHGLDEEIKKMVASVDDKIDEVGDNEYILRKMTLEDLKTLDKTVRTVKHAVNKLNKFHTVNHAKGIANLSQESILYLDSLGKAKVYDGLRGQSQKLLNWNNALPYYVFKRYGSGGMKVYEALQDGWDKFAFNTKRIIDYANDAYSSKEVKKWGEEVKTFKILIPGSETEQEVKLTVPQIMSMYCLNKREQARGHLFKGGIRVADFKDKKGNIVSQSEGFIFTEKDISAILNFLTDKQKAVADKLQEFMNTVCTDWGNEVSMARFGYKAFGEENYFPIQSDKNNLAVNDETEQVNSLFKLLNMSFTKSVIENANNRVVISDIFDVFAQHTSDMAKYNALALPVLDSFKWYNYTEKEDVADGTFITSGVKQSIERAFGKDGQNYFVTFLKDINGSQETDREQLTKSFMRNYKIASVGANLRVIALQPLSYVRASAVIDNKYLLKALRHLPKIKKAETYCGIALWKSMGYYDTNIQRGLEAQIKHANTWKDTAADWVMKGAEVADKVTWGALWNACELEIRDKRKDLKVGSEEFYQAIAKKLREVIYATQVVDSPMTRSQIMRSTKMHDQSLTNFASEPTLSYNMLQDAYMSYRLDARRMGKKEAIKKNGKKIGRILWVYTVANAVVALVESAFDALRDDDDEEMDFAKFMQYYLSNFASDMSLTAKIPYIKELHSIIKGYGLSKTELEWADSAYKAVTGFYKYLQGKGNPSTTIKNTLKTMSYLSTLPFYTVYRDNMAIFNKLDLFNEEDLNEICKDFFLYGVLD